MKQMTTGKRLVILFAALAICALSAVAAESLFPAPDELFGVTMPDIRNAVGREPDAREETDEGLTMTYEGFTIGDYDTLDVYVTAAGLELRSQIVSRGVLTADLTRDGASIILEYSYSNRRASMTYPEGTRLERTANRPAGKTSVLPDIRRIFGAAIPDLSEELPLHPSAKTVRENGTDMICYTEVSIQDYNKINSHLTALGCSAVEWHADQGILYATMMYGKGAFTIRYELEEQRFTFICPELFYPEAARAATLPSDAELVLPSALEAMGAILPRISTALLRRPDSTETTEEEYSEIYTGFTPEDYTAFSAYLVDKGCVVEDYSLDDTGVLRISLSVLGVGFSFNYDQVNHRAVACYPADAQLEPEFAASAAATPTPVPKTKPTPTPVPTAPPKNYSADKCWSIAEKYFWNLRWRNPNTVSIWSHWTGTGENGYIFYIDYSAMNGYGGYDRETYRITVNWTTGTVESAWSY